MNQDKQEGVTTQGSKFDIQEHSQSSLQIVRDVLSTVQAELQHLKGSRDEVLEDVSFWVLNIFVNFLSSWCYDR